MALLVNNQNPKLSSIFQDSSAFEHRPMMLKDFLMIDDHCFHPCSSSSSNGFQMYPRNSPCKSTVSVSSKSNTDAVVLLRSWSKRTRISAVQKVINAVRFLQFASSASGFSEKSAAKRCKDVKNEAKVKVKDILRWRSFRDMAEEDNSTPSMDFPASPNRSATTTTSSSCSKRSSWCDSDFTAEELPRWCGENEEFMGEKCLLGQPACANPKGNWPFEESEQQQSPVSVLDTPFRGEVHEDSISPFHPTLANVERAKCMLTRRIQEFDGNARTKYTRQLSFGREVAVPHAANAADVKARQLLSHVEEEDNKLNQANYEVILDFFEHELSINDGKSHDVGFDSEILRIAKSWMKGEFDESYDWEVEENRMAYVKDMEKEQCWNYKFQQEQEVVSGDLEGRVWDELVDEVLIDFLIN